MFQLAATFCWPRSQMQSEKSVNGLKTNACILDTISGIVLVLLGSLAASGHLNLYPASTFVMIGLGVFQLNHFITSLVAKMAHCMGSYGSSSTMGQTVPLLTN